MDWTVLTYVHILLMVEDVWMESARVLKNTAMQKPDVELVRILGKNTNIISFVTKS